MNAPLIDIGSLSAPATALVNRVSEAIGGIFRPWQIRRVARAEGDARIVAALSDLAVDDLQRRALDRFLEEQAHHQKNIEAITAGALPQLEPSSSPATVDTDWLSEFFGKARLVSDAEMQSLWSRILAGEANVPGSYSRRTLHIVAQLEKTEAELFTSLCSLSCRLGITTPLVYDADEALYNRRRLHFNTLKHLADIGLIRFEPIAGFVRRNLPNPFPVEYFTETVILTAAGEPPTTMEIGSVMLTASGLQLAPVSGASPVPEFFDYVLRRWAEKGFTVASAWPRANA